jgi:hypothetical protein
MFDDHGSFTMRAAIASLADECDKAWEAHAALTGTITRVRLRVLPEFISGALTERADRAGAHVAVHTLAKIGSTSGYSRSMDKPPMVVAA